MAGMGAMLPSIATGSVRFQDFLVRQLVAEAGRELTPTCYATQHASRLHPPTP